MTALGKYLTVDEAAKRLGVTPSRVYRLIGAGRLVAVRFGGKALLVNAASVKGFKRQPPGRPRSKKPAGHGRTGARQ
jgi:excisionase family DNA binding protein